MTRILVIEDEEYRIRWLRRELPEVDVVWCTTLSGFEKASMEPHDLVVFDHDMGSINGQQAARVYNGPNTTPVLVWSFNPMGGREIANIMARDRGHTSVHIAPFLSGFEQDSYRDLIRHLAGMGGTY